MSKGVGSGRIDPYRIKAEENDISASAYHSRIKNGWDRKRAATTPVKKRYRGDFAVYKGDELLVVGSPAECARCLGVKEQYIAWLSTPSSQERAKKSNNVRVSIKLDEG